jgi:hypothetical protein
MGIGILFGKSFYISVHETERFGDIWVVFPEAGNLRSREFIFSEAGCLSITELKSPKTGGL